MSTSFRVAHLSDMHHRSAIPGTAALGRGFHRSALQQALEAVRHQSVDLLILTGDTLDVPSFLLDGVPRGFQSPGNETQWLDAIRKDYQTVRTLLDATGIPYRIIPGNHDYESVFFEIFADQKNEYRAGGYRWITFNDQEQAGNVPRRLTNSQHLFRQVLQDDDPTPQVHLQHYLFHPPSGKGYPYAYREADWLRQQIADSGKVRLTLSGHYHEGTPLREENGTIYTVAEALCLPPYRWRMYQFSEQGIITATTHTLPEEAPAPVVFLDRDGVINDLASYRFGPEQMRLIPGSAAAIRRLNETGIRVVVVTSQSAIGYGYVTPEVVNMVHEKMQFLLAQENAYVDAIYYTQSAGETSILPEIRSLPTAKSTLIESALHALPLDRTKAMIVGDRMTDIKAGREVGIPGILVRTPSDYSEEQKAIAEGVPVKDNLLAAVGYILRLPMFDI